MKIQNQISIKDDRSVKFKKMEDDSTTNGDKNI